MYGTDLAAGEVVWRSNSTDDSGGYGKEATEEEKEKMLERWNYRQNLFLRYLATDDEIPWGNQIIGDIPLPEATYTVRGLALPKEVLKKVMYDNAVKWFPGIDRDF